MKTKVKNKKISLFIPSLEGGGAQRVFVNLANEFSRKNFKVDLILAQKKGPYLDFVSSKVNVIDLKAHRLLKSFFPLVKYLKKENPEFIISALNCCNILLIWSKYISRTSAKIIITQHNYFSISNKQKKERTGKFISLLAHIFYKKADNIICVSKMMKEDLAKTLKIPKEKIKVIYNPIFEESILEKSKENVEHPFLRNKENKIILAVGSLIKQKDFPNLIKAFYNLKQKEKNIKLIILGEGRERKELENLIKKLKLEKDVSMPGFVNNPYVYMKNSDVFVLSSKWEGLPTVLIEAMACGTSVVSTNCPSGPLEILENGKYGKLVSVGSPKELAKAIKETLNNPTNPKKLVKRSKYFDIEQKANEYLKLMGSRNI